MKVLIVVSAHCGCNNLRLHFSWVKILNVNKWIQKTSTGRVPVFLSGAEGVSSNKNFNDSVNVKIVLRNQKKKAEILSTGKTL